MTSHPETTLRPVKRIVNVDATRLPRWRDNLAAELVILIYKLAGAEVTVRYDDQS